MKNFPTANYLSRVNEMKSKGGRGPRSHAASWTTCLSESVGTQWIFLNEKPFLLCGSRHWWLWPMKRLNISEIFFIIFFLSGERKKSRGKWWNRKVAACVLTERNERPPQRNGDCFVCWFSLSASTCRGKGLKFVIVLRRFSHGPFFSELETQKIDWKLFFFFFFF